jgi:hypothetical protein
MIIREITILERDDRNITLTLHSGGHVTLMAEDPHSIAIVELHPHELKRLADAAAELGLVLRHGNTVPS